MKPYEKTIRDIIKEKSHILGKDVEEALASYSEVFSVSDNAFDVFTNCQTGFETHEIFSFFTAKPFVGIQ